MSDKPGSFNENPRRTPRSPENHNVNPRNKFEGVFDDKETPPKPFQQLLPDYVKSLKGLEQAAQKGKSVFFDFINEHPLMILEDYLEVIRKADAEAKSRIEVEFLKRPGSKEELEDIIGLINDPGDFRAVPVALENLKNFLSRD